MIEPDNRKYVSATAALGARAAIIVAWASGLFSLIVLILIVVHLIQVETSPPLSTPQLKALQAQIVKDKNNQELREAARALHLMGRKAFFANQTQIRVAGVLLLVGTVVFLGSMKTAVELRLRLPVPSGKQPYEGGMAEMAAGRWAVTAGASLVVVGTLAWVYLSDPAEPFSVEIPKGETVAAAGPAPAASVPAPASSPATAPSAAPAAATALEPVPVKAWPAFRGPYAAGVAHHRVAPLKWNGKTLENVAWKTAIPKPGTGSVVCWDNRVFVSGGDEQSREVYGFDGENGKLLWTGSIPMVSGALPKIMDGTTFAPATMACDAKQAYVVFATGDLAAFDFQGTKVWARSLGVPNNEYGHSSSLLVHGGLLFVQLDDKKAGRLIAVDTKKGATVWEEKRAVTECWGTPMLANTGSRLELLVTGNPLASSHDPATGKMLWSASVMGGEVTPSPAFAGGLAFFASDHSVMAAIQPGAEAKVLWKHDEALPDVSSPVATEKFVLMASSGGTVTVFDAKTGKVAWNKDFDEGFYASPVLVEDRVYLVDRAGTTWVFKMGAAYEELAKNELGEKADCTPAIPLGKVYLRSQKFLYCIAGSGK